MRYSIPQMARSKWVLIAYSIGRGIAGRIRFSLGNIQSTAGLMTAPLPASAAVDYICRTFADYLQYGGLAAEDLRGRDVLEGGVGDNFGVALLFLAAGARRVVCIDKFFSPHDPAHRREIYLKLRDTLSAEQRTRFDSIVDLSAGIEIDPNCLEAKYGKGFEEMDQVLEERSFDIVLSRAVIELVADGETLFKVFDRLLRPGGMLLHKTDLSDYRLFSSNGHHPLEFLTIPSPVYRGISMLSDRPSRRRTGFYREIMKRYGYESKIYVTAIIQTGGAKPYRELLPHKLVLEHGIDYDSNDLDLVRAIRPRLTRSFRNMSDEDLLTAGVFLAARKPA